MTIYIRGEGQLAHATRVCCGRHFSLTETPEAADIFWICHDTAVSSLDESNVEAILNDVRPIIPTLEENTLILISSQLPVGTTAILEGEFPQWEFACSPENIRVAHGVADFERQARIVVGARRAMIDPRLSLIFARFTDNVIYVDDTETAEMSKHAMNGYLAVCIAYINEVAAICAQVGADPIEVSRCLKLDPRVSPKAPLNPGGPYTGGTLARDVYTMTRLGGDRTPLIASIKKSNDRTDR